DIGVLSDWLKKIASVCASLVSTKTTHIESKAQKSAPECKPKETVLTTDNSSPLTPKASVSGEKVLGDKKQDVEKEKLSCSCCGKDGHLIIKCWEFKKLALNERYDLAKEHKLCFSCLLKKHPRKFCKEKKECEVDSCKKFHHPLLHKAENVSTETKKAENTLVAIPDSISRTVLLKVLPVILVGPNGNLKINAILDDCSTVTLLDADVCNQLGIEGREVSLSLKWLDGKSKACKNVREVSFEVQGLSSPGKFQISRARAVQNLKLPSQETDLQLLKKWNHLANVEIVATSSDPPLLLIGQDNADLITPVKVIRGRAYSPFVSITKLGAVLHGCMSGAKCESVSTVMNIIEDNSLNRLIQQSFETDAFGVKPNLELVKNSEIKQAEKVLHETTKRVGSKYETGLLWIHDGVEFPSGRDQALKRLISLENKLLKNPELACAYQGKIDEYIAKGFARLAAAIGPRTRYLPHFPVTNPNKVGKVRLVHDAAAKVQGKSLNDFLLAGPDLYRPLPTVLLNFRIGLIGFCGDIKEMFHRVEIREEDVPAQRFLWRECDQAKVPIEYEMKAMIFGSKSSPCSAQFVKNLNAKRFEDIKPEAAKAIQDNHYVDDYLHSAMSFKEASALIKDVIWIHAQGNFSICNWISSSACVLEAISPELRAGGFKELKPSTEFPTERVLGMYWNPNRDSFVFGCQFHKVASDIVDGSQDPSKREMLRYLMSIYDPLGFLSTFTIRGKVLMQNTWRFQVDWDDILDGDLLRQWKEWIQLLPLAKLIEIPRCYSGLLKDMDSCDLHVFVDASEEAFCAVAYLAVYKGDMIDVSLMMARTRLAPLKSLSIPRLELQGALMGARLVHTIKGELDLIIRESHIWTDSKTVLLWLRSCPRNFKPFVSHRIGEILEISADVIWHWLPTDLNVADEATRSKGKFDLSPQSRWIQGPEFLRRDKMYWPEMPTDFYENLSSSKEEIKLKYVGLAYDEKPVIVIERFSNYWKLIRTTAWALRAVRLFKGRYKLKSLTKDIQTWLTCDEIKAAEVYWIKKTQEQCFKNELLRLKQGLEILKSSKLISLNPRIDEEDILRVQSRIERSPDLSQDQKSPIILDPNNSYTKLLLANFHLDAHHQGIEKVLNRVRQKYWVLQGRKAVKSTWSRCIRCKIDRAQPFVPMMGVTRTIKPFVYTESTQPLYPAGAVSSGELDPLNECTIKIGKVQSDGTSGRTLREVKVQPLNPVGTVNSGERIPVAFTQVPHKGLAPRTAGRISQVEVQPVNPAGAVNTGESIPAFTQVLLEQASVVVNSQLLPVNVENDSSTLGG
ncbi:unnamed protein product, partial [Allacma fusca]